MSYETIQDAMRRRRKNCRLVVAVCEVRGLGCDVTGARYEAIFILQVILVFFYVVSS